MTLPEDLRTLVAGIDAIEEEARHLVDGLDEPQLNWQPDEGRGWSVGQCLDHLARINTFYVGAILPAVEEAARRGAGSFRGLHPTWLGRRFVASLEPPVTMRLKVPSPSLAPPSRIVRTRVMDDFTAAHRPYRGLVALAAGLDPNRVRVRNPFFTRVWMRLSTALLVIPAHDRRHLWQAQNVVKKLRSCG